MSPFEEAMQEVLTRPQYDILTGRAVDHQQIIMEAIGRALINLLGRINLSLPEPSAYNLELITLLFVISAALLLLGTAMGVTYFLLRRRGRRAKTAGEAALFDDIANKRYSLRELLRLSKEYEEKRQFREAVRHHYIAVLVALNEKNTIQVDKSKTNAQLAGELAEAAPGLSGSFAAVVEVFQQSWFGLKGIDEASYRRFAAIAGEIHYG